MNEKFILDATCGGRMMWFNKNHPNTIYNDIRKEEKGFLTERSNFCVVPDQIADFKNMPFKDGQFKLVIWDPPHLLNLGSNSWIRKKYGGLNADTFADDIKKGYQESMRVLDNFGILILKWSWTKENRPNRDVKLNELLKILPDQPLFGHPTMKANTIWLCFMKFPRAHFSTSGEKSLES